MFNARDYIEIRRVVSNAENNINSIPKIRCHQTRCIYLNLITYLTTKFCHYRYTGIDAVYVLIIEIETGKRIKAVKGVTLAEEYLADHFPTFPVLPGVLLLEGLIESASWLVRVTENFAHSMVLLEEARNVKYKSFLAPGAQIEYSVEAKTIEENVSSFSGTGISNGEQIVEARFGLRHFNLAEQDSGLAAVDANIISEMKKRWELLKK